jgi:S-adenosylmethionine:tRNA ribosyltransferase-isomerase
MHAEWFSIDAKAAGMVNRTERGTGRLVAVGTTSARALEAAADEDGPIRPLRGKTELFIYPGYKFKVLGNGALLTNFHLPRSTLLMLVCAFAGRDFILKAYREAIQMEYRFYSYGDAMLIL